MHTASSCAEPISSGTTDPVDDQLEVAPGDWPWWRGPTRNGVAHPGQQPPLTWNEREHVRWRSKVPGRGHGSPTVVGDQVFLAIADHERDVQGLACYDRYTGAVRWETVLHHGGLTVKNERSTAASGTPACVGDLVLINFLNHNAVYTSAIRRTGELVWQTKICDYIIHQGYGSSPAVYRSLVLVSADNKGGGVLTALDQQTGGAVWSRPRPATPNYPSPILLHTAGRDQLVLTGCELVSSFNPLTGDTLWEIPGATTECVTSTVTDGTHVFTSGGYPRNHMAAVKADGTGEVVWENGARVYVPSMLVAQNHLYAVMDAGVAACWNCATGDEIWKTRLGGNFSASPILVGDRIYATNETGETHVFRASPKGFESLARNQLGDEVFATPAICAGQIFTRIAKMEGDVRQEYLFCIDASVP